jgi:hypothetical protein
MMLYSAKSAAETEALFWGEHSVKLSHLIVISSLVLSGFVASTSTVTAVDVVFDDNQVPILNRFMDGSLHIISDDSLEKEVVDAPSMLSLSSYNVTTFCTSADDGICAGQTDLGFVAHLPQCDGTEATDCIVSVSATPKGGTPASATFDRYFPNYGPQSFTGKPSLKLPTGRAPSVWKIPSAPHIGGDEYAVVARLRGSTGNRKAASFQLALAAVTEKTDADTSNSYGPPRWIVPGRMAGPASDRGLFRCAYWGDDGACLLSRQFPEDISFSITVRLAVEPAGWLHGRINEPSISFTKDGDNTLVRVTAAPVQVPAFQSGKMYSEFPADVQRAFAVDGPYGSGGSRQPGGAERTDPALRNAEYSLVAYEDKAFEQLALMTDVISDKAGWAPWIWRVRTLSDDEMNKAGKCLTTGDGVKGIVTTNASVYGSGPPVFNTATSSLDYKVAAPHYTRTGDVFKGAYNLIIRSDVARCFYNFTSAPVEAEISVTEQDGATSTAVTSISEKDGWLKLSASGFTHSAPTIRSKLMQQTPIKETPATTNTLAPVQAIMPIVAKPTGLTARANKSVLGTSLLKTAGLKLPKAAKISLSVAAKYKKLCKVSGTSLRTLTAGKCVVKVTVTTSTKRKTSKSVTVTIKK